MYEFVIVIIFLSPATQKKNDQSKLKYTKHITDELFWWMNLTHTVYMHASPQTQRMVGTSSIVDINGKMEA